MYNKTYFLIIMNRKLEALLFRKKHFNRWELPIIKSSNEKPVSLLIEDYMKKHISAPYKIIGESSVRNSYDWPKELIAITGKTGEENRFMYVKLFGEIDNNSLISKEYDLLQFHTYDELVDKIVFKNHRPVLKNVFDELMKRMHEMRQDELDSVQKNQDYFSGIDKIF